MKIPGDGDQYSDDECVIRGKPKPGIMINAGEKSAQSRPRPAERAVSAVCFAKAPSPSAAACDGLGRGVEGLP